MAASSKLPVWTKLPAVPNVTHHTDWNVTIDGETKTLYVIHKAQGLLLLQCHDSDPKWIKCNTTNDVPKQMFDMAAMVIDKQSNLFCCSDKGIVFKIKCGNNDDNKWDIAKTSQEYMEAQGVLIEDEFNLIMHDDIMAAKHVKLNASKFITIHNLSFNFGKIVQCKTDLYSFGVTVGVHSFKPNSVNAKDIHKYNVLNTV